MIHGAWCGGPTQDRGVGVCWKAGIIAALELRLEGFLECDPGRRGSGAADARPALVLQCHERGAEPRQLRLDGAVQREGHRDGRVVDGVPGGDVLGQVLRGDRTVSDPGCVGLVWNGGRTPMNSSRFGGQMHGIFTPLVPSQSLMPPSVSGALTPRV